MSLFAFLSLFPSIWWHTERPPPALPPHMHTLTLTQTCQSSGMRGMHTLPREWSPSIQCGLSFPQCDTPWGVQNVQPPPLTSSHHRSIHSPKVSQDGEQHVFNPHLTMRRTYSITALEFLVALWCGTSHHSDEVYTLKLSDFKGMFPVWTAQERDVFTAGCPNLYRETSAQVDHRFVTHLQWWKGTNAALTWIQTTDIMLVDQSRCHCCPKLNYLNFLPSPATEFITGCYKACRRKPVCYNHYK